ncbi:dihydrolipoamide acetyltransferase family protein [Salinicoccus albus]|uniref:dihydrolipoamide acetyltransferase family protein n=1 Tax=Salinicoccus albus TaxID=418756 RepID=UPI00035F7D0D|nr:dihydrolipoamide acetyltransferase family protein [Salinicoccus albus]
MAENIVMPKLGMTMKEGTVEEWHKSVGDTVEAGETVATISSEKLSQDVESPGAGELLEIKVDAGDSIEVKGIMGVIGEAGESTVEAGSAEDEGEAETPETAGKDEPAETPAEAPQTQNADKRPAGSAQADVRIFISPLARRMAAEHDLPIEQIEGTGGNGRITRLDINRVLAGGLDKAAAAGETAEAAGTTPQAADVGEGLNPMRKTIARNMRASLDNTAQLTLHRKAEIDQLIDFQKKLRTEAEQSSIDVKLSLTVLIAKATVLALQDYKKMNSRYENGELTEYDAVHLGIATALDEGLVVPVVKHAEQKSIGALAEEIRDLSAQARHGEASQETLSGSTFSISNMGGSGVEYFTPILNTAESGILGVGAFQKELAMVNDEVTEITKIPFSLTFDHQILDGAAAGEFLTILVRYIENPYLLVL